MPRVTDPIHKTTLRLREGDLDFLRERFPRIGASGVIRRIVSNFVDKLDRPVPDAQIQEILADEKAKLLEENADV